MCQKVKKKKMKKPKEEVINFMVSIPKANKTVKLLLPNTTKILEVSKAVSSLMGLSKNLTRISYSKSHFPHQIGDKHSLRQIDLRNGDTIYADIGSSTAPSKYEIGPSAKNHVDVDTKEIGWNHIYEDVKDVYSE